MAYVFSAIKDAMGKDQPVKQDIFAPQQNPNQSGSDASAMGMQPKTSTEGELTGGGGGGTQQSSEGIPADVQATTGNARALRQNKMGVPSFVNQAQDSIGAAEKGIQDEANSYVSGAKAKSFTIDDSDIEKAIGGDESLRSTVGRRALGEDAMDAQKYDTFEPKTAYNFSDIDQLRTDEGTKGLLRRGAGAQYTGGESAFDLMLLNRTPEFNTIRSQLTQRQDGLNKQVDDFRTSKTDEARKALEANYKAGQEQVSGYLGTKSSELLKAQEAEAAAENAARAELRKTGNKAVTESRAAAILKQLKKENAGNDPSGILRHLGEGVNAADFYSVGDDVDYSAAIDAKEAARFNAINSLLGKTDSWAAGDGLGDRETFLANDFRSAAQRGAMDAETKANQRAQAALDKEISRITQRASGGYNLNNIIQSGGVQNELKDLYGDVWDSGFVNEIDSSPYQKAMDWRRYVTAEDAQRLNSYNDELGLGRLQVGGGNGDGGFDRQNYRAALQAALDTRRNQSAEERAAEDAARRQRESERAARLGGANGVPAGVTQGQVDETRNQDYTTGGSSNSGSNTVAEGVVGAAERAGGALGKANPTKKWCFPAGVRFLMDDGSVQDVLTIEVGDVMSQGGTVLEVHDGDSEDLYLLGTALVTGSHPVLIDGEWVLVKDVDDAIPVDGDFKVYSVTNSLHQMVHESGLIFGDFQADEIYGVEE